MSHNLDNLDTSIDSFQDCDENSTLLHSSEEEREIIFNDFLDPDTPQVRSSSPTGVTPPAGSFIFNDFPFFTATEKLGKGFLQLDYVKVLFVSLDTDKTQ